MSPATPAALLKYAPAAGVWLVMLWVSPLAGLAVAALAAGLWGSTREGAQSVILAALSFPGGVWLIDHPGLLWVALSAALGCLLAWLVSRTRK